MVGAFCCGRLGRLDLAWMGRRRRGIRWARIGGLSWRGVIAFILLTFITFILAFTLGFLGLKGCSKCLAYLIAMLCANHL